MSPLNAYVHQMNLRQTLFGLPPIRLPDDISQISKALDGELHPDNLSQHSHNNTPTIAQRRAFFAAARRELASRYPRPARQDATA